MIVMSSVPELGDFTCKKMLLDGGADCVGGPTYL